MLLRAFFSSFILRAMNEVYGGADVDGSCQPWTEVVFRRRKLYSVDGSCIVNREGISLTCYPSPLSESQN